MPHPHDSKGAPVRVSVLTISDTRTLDTDESGALAEQLLRDAGHDFVERTLVPDDVPAIRAAVLRLLAEARVVVTTGGTGVAARDSTYEAVSALLEKRLDGFGELFRALSFAEIGAAAMLSRAVAGTCRGGVVVALPGSKAAVRLAVEKLVVPELAHLAGLATSAAASASALSHLDASGHAHMVDVGDKDPSDREAVAQAVVTMSAEARAQLHEGRAAKGDVLGIARVAGIQAAKRTSELIPLCHPLPLSAVSVDFDFHGDALRVTAHARTHGRTGVEMEALVAASIAALTIYDMLKSVDRAMEIGETYLLRKSGGRRGVYERP